jgi:molecular chaperone HtpG
MNTDFDNQLNKSTIYKQLKERCEKCNQHEVLTLVSEVGNFAVMRLKTVIKNMLRISLHLNTNYGNT